MKEKPTQPLIFMMSVSLTLTHHSPKQTHRAVTAVMTAVIQQCTQPFQLVVKTRSTHQLQQNLPVQAT